MTITYNGLGKRVIEANPLDDKRNLYKTAYCQQINAFCAIRRYGPKTDAYLCNFGYRDVWMAAEELSRFCL